MADRSMEHSAQAEIAARYGREHPGEFGGVWLEGDRMQVGFTDPEPHVLPLRELLGPSSDVDVVRVRHTAAALQAVFDEISEQLGGGDHVLQMVGLGARTVHVGLRADGVPVAERLLRTYGDMVEVTVGARPYPPPTKPGSEARARKRRYGPTATAERPDLELQAVLDVNAVQAGQDFRGRVLVRNLGQPATTLVTDEPLTALVLDQHGRLAGTSSGLTAGTEVGLTLLPGETAEIGFSGGTAGVADYATPPGEYRVVVIVPDRDRGGQLLTPPVPLRLASSE